MSENRTGQKRRNGLHSRSKYMFLASAVVGHRRLTNKERSFLREMRLQQVTPREAMARLGF